MSIRRYLTLNESAIEADKDAPILTGNACVYNSLSRPLPFSNGRKFRERIAPDAFTATLSDAKNEIICTANHNTGQILGRTRNNTLEIFNSAEALKVRCALPDTSYAKDLLISVRRGDVIGMSFTFDESEPFVESEASEDGLPIITVKRAFLYEVCFTSDPAYYSSTVSMRSADILKISRTPVVKPHNMRSNLLRFGISLRG